MKKKKIITRFAPSPTGKLHLGSVRTALFSWAYAKNNNGLFYLRIENSDNKRTTKGAIKNIIKTMKILNLKYDGKIIFQNKRIKKYKKILIKMIKNGTAYYCYSSKKKNKNDKKKNKYNKIWRPEKNKILPKIPKNVNPVIRFKNPLKGYVSWKDLVKGNIKINNSELDDIIIARSDGKPTYNFCSVIDDIDMKISHIIRGDDHINNTPIQINILNSLKKKTPKYIHIPMIFNENGKKLSKRNNEKSIIEYYKKGFLPEAIINYLIRLGWSCKNKEIFSRKEIIKLFNYENISKSPSRFDEKKLIWLNKFYIKNIENKKIIKFIKIKLKKKKIKIKNNKLLNLINLFKERSNSLIDILKYIKKYYLLPKINIKLINKHIKNKNILKKIINIFYKTNWNKIKIYESIKNISIIEKVELPKLINFLKILILNKKNSLPVSSLLEIFGKKNIIKKIKNIYKKINLN